ncbi:DUF5659 domain-containing protein [Peribacillus frigoritolerans]|uniref:DUF5659 domain-containing protein n=1 Tax=Peribacillus frigoritolerans TaxID=450367 RepID=UPI0036279D7B
MSKKRIFNLKMANFLISNGAELLETRQGEVRDKPERHTFIFKNDERLSKALLDFKKI